LYDLNPKVTTNGGSFVKSQKAAPTTIDEYIAGFPKDIQEILEQIRSTIRETAPDAEETISYQMPTFDYKGHYLVYFAAYKNHIGFYPAPTGNPEFTKELELYGAGKGTLKFPLSKPIPFDVIRKVVEYRMKENLARVAQEKKY
jgi:uncharacterized protein YdhG (YjbR/CyaY superfamily)